MVAFGADHPYGRPTQGLPSTVETIGRDDLAGFHDTYWQPGTSALVMVGAVSPEQAVELAEKNFGSWERGRAPGVEVPEPQPMERGQIFLVDRPDAAQTVVAQVLPAPRRKVEDYYALTLVDSVWGGGGFGTRLNLNLREDKGYSYGVFSNMALYSDAGVWWAQGSVQTDKTKESVVEFDKELAGIAGTEPVTATELESAIQKFVRGYAQQFESYPRVGNQIVDLWVQGLEMEELRKLAKETAGVTMDEVLAASARYVDPNQASLLLVGNREVIEEDVRSLDLGEVVILDTEGNPVNEQ